MFYVFYFLCIFFVMFLFFNDFVHFNVMFFVFLKLLEYIVQMC